MYHTVSYLCTPRHTGQDNGKGLILFWCEPLSYPGTKTNEYKFAVKKISIQALTQLYWMNIMPKKCLRKI